MIFYFSGTGNSRYVASKLAEQISEELVFIPECVACEQRFSGHSLGFVFPIYSWGVPPIVLQFINDLADGFMDEVRDRGINVWMVCTCGDETGKAPQMLQTALDKRGVVLSGIWSVQMPNNYVLLPGFNVDSEEVATGKIDKAPARIHAIADDICNGRMIMDYVEGPNPAMKTRLIYPLFKKWGINPSKWHWTEECVRCGRCGTVCPQGNVSIVNGHPRWGKNCVSCLACYHVCPSHAVEYGSITRKKGQYFMR